MFKNWNEGLIMMWLQITLLVPFWKFCYLLCQLLKFLNAYLVNRQIYFSFRMKKLLSCKMCVCPLSHVYGKGNHRVTHLAKQKQFSRLLFAWVTYRCAPRTVLEFQVVWDAEEEQTMVENQKLFKPWKKELVLSRPPFLELKTSIK